MGNVINYQEINKSIEAEPGITRDELANKTKALKLKQLLQLCSNNKGKHEHRRKMDVSVSSECCNKIPKTC